MRNILRRFFWYGASVMLITTAGIFFLNNSSNINKGDITSEEIAVPENDTTHLLLSGNRKNVQSFSRLWPYSEVFMY